MSAKRSDRNGRSWTSCPLLQIRKGTERTGRGPSSVPGILWAPIGRTGEYANIPCMMFGGLHAGSWEILIIPVVMMLLFAVTLVRMYHGGHR